jgi:hypothetical protein
LGRILNEKEQEMLVSAKWFLFQPAFGSTALPSTDDHLQGCLDNCKNLMS